MGAVAAEGGAAAVADPHRDPHGLGVEAALSADVEGFGGSAEHDRHDPGLTGQPAGFAGGDPGAVTQLS